MGVKEPAATRYVVLWQPGDTSSHAQWTHHGEFDAKSAEGAIRKSADDGAGGVYVAVPARSWKPMRVEQVQTVQTVITAADEPVQPVPVEDWVKAEAEAEAS